MTKVSKAGQCETKETQGNRKSIKIALMSEMAGSVFWGIVDRKAEKGRRTPGRWRVLRRLANGAKRFGVRQPSGAFTNPHPARIRPPLKFCPF
jgi:hypothetical protein